MADDSIIIDIEVNDEKAQAELKRLEKQINKLNDELSKNKNKQNAIKTKLEAARKEALKTEQVLRRLNAELAEAQAITSGQTQKNPSGLIHTAVWQEEISNRLREQEALLKQQNQEAQRLDAQYTKITATVIGQSYGFAKAKDEAGEYVAQLGKVPADVQKLGPAMEKAQKDAQQFGMRIREVVHNVSAFMLTQALVKFQEWMGKVITSNAEASAAIAKLKGAFLTLVQPLASVIIPVFITLVNILTKIVSAIANVFSSFFGMTTEDSAQAAETMYEEQNAIEGVGNAAQKASKSLASFDEINKLSGNASGGGSEGSSGDISPDFDIKDGSLSEILGKAAGWVTAALMLGGIALIAIGAGMLKLNLVLAGIAMLTTGIAIGIDTGVIQNWAEVLGLKNVSGFMTAALLLAGIALIAIGASMVKFGIVAAGLGLLGSGIVIGVMSGTLQEWAKALGLETVFDYVVVAIQLAGIALIAIGAKMSNIFMVLAGAIILGIGVAAEMIGEQTLADWWEMLKLTTVEQWIGVATMLVGIVLVAIGACLTNILMVVAGMAFIGLSAFINIKEGNLRNWAETLGLDKVMGWAGTALVLLGIALLVFGIATVNIPMVLASIGLLGAGIVITATNGSFQDYLKQISDPLISTIEEVMNWFGKVKDAIQSAIDKLKEFFQMGADENQNMIINNTPGLRRSSYSLSKSEIPRLAAGAVIPPNRQFLAMLGDQKSGTNVEAPLATIEQALINALNRAGYGDQRQAILEVDGQQFGKLVYRYGNKETRRVGVSLVGR